MTHDFEKSVERLFDELLELPVDERRARLDALSDPELRRRVEALLGSHDEADTQFLTSPFEPPSGPWTFGEFDMQRRLGWGGMGEVWLARQKSLDRDVAVKVLRPTSHLDPELVQRFQREGLAGRLHHPHIIHLIDMGSHDNRHYVVMEHIEGCTLRDVLDARRDPARAEALPPFARSLGTMSATDFQRWVSAAVAKIADALHHAHEHGVWHRDVKPENILIDARLEPVLIDFGLAVAPDAEQSLLTATDQMMGTVHYMSPEQAVREKFSMDHRTDIFSLGVVFFECLTLTRPFVGDSNAQVVSLILTYRPQFVDRVDRHVSGTMAAVVARAMRKKPDNRFQSAREMAKAIEAVLDGRPIVPPPGRLDRLRVYAAHHRTLARTAAAVAAALAVVVGTVITYPALTGYLARPSLSVEARDATGTPLAGARVWLQERSGFGRDIGAAEYIGMTPVDGVRVRSGRYWVQITHDDLGQAELSREFGDGEAPTVRAVLRDEVRLPLVDVAAGEATLDWDCVECPRRPEWPEAPYMRSKTSVHAFSIGRFEVSNGEYEAFLGDSAYFAWRDEKPPRPPFFWQAERPDDWDVLPASGVSLGDARRFAEWAGGRLPTSLEWQFAMRGPDGSSFPWGDERDDPPGSRAVYGREYAERPRPLDPVDDQRRARFRSYLAGVESTRSYPQGATASGLHHALGNVEEWTESYNLLFDGMTHTVDEARVLVIGSYWYSKTERALLHWQAPNTTGGSESIGFRIVRRTFAHDRPS